MLVASGPTQAQSQAQALLSKGREVAQRLRQITPETVKQMPDAQALELFTTAQEVTLAIIHIAYKEAAQAQGQEMNEAGFRRFLSSNGLEYLMPEELQKKVDLLGTRLTANQKDAVGVELQHRYPAYGAYVKRSLVSDVIRSLSGPKVEVTEAYETNGTMPAKMEAETLGDVLKLKGVRAANYENGRFTVVFNDAIQEGGMLELVAFPKRNGELKRKCSGSKCRKTSCPHRVGRRNDQGAETTAARLIAVTAYGQPQHRRCALAAGFDEHQHLVKPVNPDVLVGELAFA